MQSNSQDKTILYAVISLAVVVGLPLVLCMCIFLSSAVMRIVITERYDDAMVGDYLDFDYDYEEPLEEVTAIEVDYEWTYAYVEELGLDLEQYKADLADPAIRARVDNDMFEGESKNVNGTPTMFVNGANKGPVVDLGSVIDPEIAEGDVPVVIEEYVDLECPFCKQSHIVKQEIKATYGDQVLFIHKHFPLTSIHKNAYAAAVASEAAREQGMFDEFVDLIFENQDELTDPSFRD